MTPVCPTCNRPYEGLACEPCTTRASQQAIREYQYAPLRKCMAGRDWLKVRWMAGIRHIQMFGTELTYCGLEARQGHRISYIEFDPAQMNRLCGKCRALLYEIADEARRAA